MLNRRSFLRLGAVTSAALGFSTPPFAQVKWPSRHITAVVPFAAGGTTDLVARMIAPSMSKILGQQIVIENRVGAAGALGSDFVAKAAKDGYTFGVGTISTHVIAPVIMRRPPYNPATDFTPVALVATTPLGVFLHPSVGALTLAELQKKALANPGIFNFGSPGHGSLGHLAGLWFNQLAGTSLTHVPYRGSAPALQDLLGGRIHVMFDNIPTILPSVASGAVIAAAVTSPSRVPTLPLAQTTAEAGFPDFRILTWTMLLAPAGIPANIVAAANAAVNGALGDQDTRTRLADMSIDASEGSPEQAASFLQAEIAKWTPIAKSSGTIIE